MKTTATNIPIFESDILELLEDLAYERIKQLRIRKSNISFLRDREQEYEIIEEKIKRIEQIKSRIGILRNSGKEIIKRKQEVMTEIRDTVKEDVSKKFTELSKIYETTVLEFDRLNKDYMKEMELHDKYKKHMKEHMKDLDSRLKEEKNKSKALRVALKEKESDLKYLSDKYAESTQECIELSHQLDEFINTEKTINCKTPEFDKEELKNEIEELRKEYGEIFNTCIKLRREVKRKNELYESAMEKTKLMQRERESYLMRATAAIQAANLVEKNRKNKN